MIHVDRSKVPAPAVLSDPKRKGPREAAKAERSLAKWSADNKPVAEWTFTFSAYRDPEVKEALAKLFHGKCAYCESSYNATQPMDVEHWRPKGQIEGSDGPIKPAYYWLAASWDNTLPSCIDCNRRRVQRDALDNSDRAIGKQDQFPLEGGSAHAKSPAQIPHEIPLLLNPCYDDPEDFLECTDEGLVVPQTGDDLRQRRARASIDVYALNRNGLVLARKQFIRHVRLRIARVAQISRVMDDAAVSDPIALVLDDLLASDLQELARMRRADQPYALFARRLVDRWMSELIESGRVLTAINTTAQPGRVE